MKPSPINSGILLWKKAKKLIPGGSMLFSKRSENFLPEKWPSYYSKAKGCTIWDLDGNKYIDISLMGVGTNILGYGHPEVDEAVMEVVDKGNMSTLQCPEEVYLSDLADDFSRQFGTRVQIRRKGEKGKIEIDFYSNEDLDRLIGLLNQQP